MRTINYVGSTKKLSKVISEKYGDISYSYIQKLFRKSDVKVNGKRVHTDVTVNGGDEIIIYYQEQEKTTFAPEILFEDGNLVAYAKPIKIASEGDNSFEDKVHKFINQDYILCHRLDTNTAGILLFAKNRAVFNELKRQFKLNNIEKHYYALVYGKLRSPATFTDYLVKDADKGRVFVYQQPKKDSKKIITMVEPIEFRGETTLLDVMLVTGRTHQIRAHLAFKGYPIIGDSKYGREEINRQFNAKTQKLVAYKLIFNITEGELHYLNKKQITLNSVNL